jgi:thiol-disulfide isomerase/thioredoxin
MAKNKTFIIFITLVIAAVVFGIISIMTAPKKIVPLKEEEIVKKRIFKPAPDFALMDINGAEKRLSDFKNKVVILDFFATWCSPCRDEIPHFIDLYTRYRDRGLEIVGVALDWNAMRIVPVFSEDNGINYTVLIGNEEVSDLYGGIAALPTTFILDRDGNIVKRYVGYRDKEVFEKDIEELL